MGEKEDTLMNVIANTLEEFGYIPRLRGSLKVMSFRKGQELMRGGEISNCSSLNKVHISPEDRRLLGLCIDLFGACGLPNTKEMVLLETDCEGLDVRKEYPGYAEDVAVLPQIVKSVRPRFE
jgi:hypothetical protein